MTASPGHSLKLDNITKKYGQLAVVRDVSLDVGSGRFLTLLGPSGSGKTSILTMIAGFSEPTAGRILLDDRDITTTPPEKRSFGMVFQGYALFPHMTVADNVDFPLRVRKVGKAERTQRVRAALDLVQLTNLGHRKPSELSGGQQQRVALARALVFDPAVLLLDEPLSALDKKLRAELQEELKALHQRVGRTFINVTHDQEEALSMSDEIAILDRGRVAQFGSPNELYERPRTRFVASFLGSSNFIEGEVVRQDGNSFLVRSGALQLRAAGQAPGKRALLALRPEKVEIVANAGGENTACGTVTSWAYLGSGYSLLVKTEGFGSVRVNLSSWKAPVKPRDGMEINLGWSSDALVPVLEDAE